MDKDLEQTKRMNTFMIGLDDEESVVDSINEFEEKLEYMDITEEKKKTLKHLCEEIKKEKDEKARDYLFKLLQKEAE